MKKLEKILKLIYFLLTNLLTNFEKFSNIQNEFKKFDENEKKEMKKPESITGRMKSPRWYSKTWELSDDQRTFRGIIPNFWRISPFIKSSKEFFQCSYKKIGVPAVFRISFFRSGFRNFFCFDHGSDSQCFKMLYQLTQSVALKFLQNYFKKLQKFFFDNLKSFFSPF